VSPEEYRVWAVKVADDGGMPCATRLRTWHSNHSCDCKGSGPFGERMPGDVAWPWWLAVPAATVRRWLP
jgi:hypothetical protein